MYFLSNFVLILIKIYIIVTFGISSRFKLSSTVHYYNKYFRRQIIDSKLPQTTLMDVSIFINFRYISNVYIVICYLVNLTKSALRYNLHTIEQREPSVKTLCYPLLPKFSRTERRRWCQIAILINNNSFLIYSRTRRKVGNGVS